MKKICWNWADATLHEYWVRFILSSAAFLLLVLVPVLARAMWSSEWASIGIFVGGSLVHGVFALLGLAFLKPKSLGAFCLGAGALTLVSRTLVLLPNMQEGTAGAIFAFLAEQATIVMLAAGAAFLLVGAGRSVNSARQ